MAADGMTQHRNNKGWIGCDLDGTLAHYDHWRGVEHVGAPIWPMVTRVKDWLATGYRVKIFTARVYGVTGAELTAVVGPIVKFLHSVGLPTLDITCVKDFHMIELWDDRAVQVIPNTGRTIADELASERSARAGTP
jgi:hypothetical protein